MIGRWLRRVLSLETVQALDALAAGAATAIGAMITGSGLGLLLAGERGLGWSVIAYGVPIALLGIPLRVWWLWR